MDHTAKCSFLQGPTGLPSWTLYLASSVAALTKSAQYSRRARFSGPFSSLRFTRSCLWSFRVWSGFSAVVSGMTQLQSASYLPMGCSW